MEKYLGGRRRDWYIMWCDEEYSRETEEIVNVGKIIFVQWKIEPNYFFVHDFSFLLQATYEKFLIKDVKMILLYGSKEENIKLFFSCM